jgi:hypothetical protein
MVLVMLATLMIAVSKSAKTVGKQKQTVPEIGKKRPQPARLAKAIW